MGEGCQSKRDGEWGLNMRRSTDPRFTLITPPQPGKHFFLDFFALFQTRSHLFPFPHLLLLQDVLTEYRYKCSKKDEKATREVVCGLPRPHSAVSPLC